MAELAIPLTPPPGREDDPYYNITAEEERYRVSATITDGVVPLKRLIKGNILNPETYLGTCFSLVPGDGLSVILSPGIAVCGHTYYMNTEFKRFVLTAGSTYDIVIFLDLVASNCYAKAIKRAEGVATINNALLRDQTGYQIGLWEAKIPAGATAITNAMLVDHRLDTTPCTNGEPVCGMVTGPMQIDTRMVVERFEREQRDFLARSQELRDEDRKECLQLIEDLRGLLEEDPAGALQNAIDSLEKRADRSDPIPGECRVFDSHERMPDFWLPANGGEVLREKYPDLFAAIGTKYGAGNGATTFNLPEIKPQKRRALKEMKLEPFHGLPHGIGTQRSPSGICVNQFFQFGDDLLIGNAGGYGALGILSGDMWFFDHEFNISHTMIYMINNTGVEGPYMCKTVAVDESTILCGAYTICTNTASWKSWLHQTKIRGFPYQDAAFHSAGKRNKRYYYYAHGTINGIVYILLESTEDFVTWKNENKEPLTSALGHVTSPYKNVQMVVTESHAFVVVGTAASDKISIIRIPLNQVDKITTVTVSASGYSYILKDGAQGTTAYPTLPVHLVYCPKQGRLILAIISSSDNTGNGSYYTTIYESKDMGASWGRVFSENTGSNHMARIRSIRVVDDQLLIVKKSGLYLFGADNIMRALPFSGLNPGFYSAYGFDDFCIWDAAWYQNRLIVSAGWHPFSRHYISEPNFKGFVEDMPYGIYAGRVLDR